MSNYFNGAQCDIYIGTGAGEQMMNEVYGVKKSLQIISPYSSDAMMQQLAAMHTKGIDVTYITSPDFLNVSNIGNVVRTLVTQHCTIDESGLRKMNSLKWIRYVVFTALALWLCYIGFYLFNSPVKSYSTFIVMASIPALLYGILRTLKSKMLGIRVYGYSYSSTFKLKVVKRDGNSTLIHSKVVVIDEEIAYLGSLNFTLRGTKYNHETRVRTEDTGALKALIGEFYTLLYHSNIEYYTINELGSFYYHEPMNDYYKR